MSTDEIEERAARELETARSEYEAALAAYTAAHKMFSERARNAPFDLVLGEEVDNEALARDVLLAARKRLEDLSR